MGRKPDAGKAKWGGNRLEGGRSALEGGFPVANEGWRPEPVDICHYS